MISDVCMMVVVRPGPTEDNYVDKLSSEPKTGRWSGSDKTPLSKKGKEMAEKIADLFISVDFHQVYCSKALRTYETAKIILGNRLVPIESEDHFYEMNIGPFEDKVPEEIFSIFKEKTKYPSEETKQTLPKLWAKRNGALVNANDCLLDKWHPEIDTFDDFYKYCIPKITETAKKHLGKTILIIPHGTPMKSIIAEAKQVPVDQVICDKGAYFVAEVDKEGKFTLIEEMMRGIQY